MKKKRYLLTRREGPVSVIVSIIFFFSIERRMRYLSFKNRILVDFEWRSK
jgi:hypothetical protein